MPTVSELDDQPDAYLVNQVRVFGLVGAIVGPGTFVLTDPEHSGGDEVLVLAPGQAIAVSGQDELKAGERASISDHRYRPYG